MCAKLGWGEQHVIITGRLRGTGFAVSHSGWVLRLYPSGFKRRWHIFVGLRHVSKLITLC
jgi:hypothetical protein